MEITKVSNLPNSVVVLSLPLSSPPYAQNHKNTLSKQGEPDYLLHKDQLATGSRGTHKAPAGVYKKS